MSGLPERTQTAARDGGRRSSWDFPGVSPALALVRVSPDPSRTTGVCRAWAPPAPGVVQKFHTHLRTLISANFLSQAWFVPMPSLPPTEDCRPNSQEVPPLGSSELKQIEIKTAEWLVFRLGFIAQFKARITEVIKQHCLCDMISQVAKSVCHLHQQIELILHYRLWGTV